MDPDSRFGIGRDLASSMAEASYYRDNEGNAQEIPSPENNKRGYDTAMRTIAARVAPGVTAEAIVNSRGEVAIGFRGPNGDPVGVGIRGTDHLYDDGLQYGNVTTGRPSAASRTIADAIAEFAQPELGMQVTASVGWVKPTTFFKNCNC